MKRIYTTPILFEADDQTPTSGSVIGEGTGQGSISPYMTFEEWWVDIAWEGENYDCDYNGDGEVNRDDYDYYIENELWNG